MGGPYVSCAGMGCPGAWFLVCTNCITGKAGHAALPCGLLRALEARATWLCIPLPGRGTHLGALLHTVLNRALHVHAARAAAEPEAARGVRHSVQARQVGADGDALGGAGVAHKQAGAGRTSDRLEQPGGPGRVGRGGGIRGGAGVAAWPVPENSTMLGTQGCMRMLPQCYAASARSPHPPDQRPHLTMSAVGTSILANAPSGGGAYGPTWLFQERQQPAATSNW